MARQTAAEKRAAAEAESGAESPLPDAEAPAVQHAAANPGKKAVDTEYVVLRRVTGIITRDAAGEEIDSPGEAVDSWLEVARVSGANAAIVTRAVAENTDTPGDYVAIPARSWNVIPRQKKVETKWV